MKKLFILLVLGVIIYFATSFIATNVKRQVITKKYEESSKERTADLILNTAHTAYVSAQMKNVGYNPTISSLKDSIKSELNNLKSIESTSTTLTIVTTDDVTCTFSLDGDTLKLTDSCGGKYKGKLLEIGKITIE